MQVKSINRCSRWFVLLILTGLSACGLFDSESEIAQPGGLISDSLFFTYPTSSVQFIMDFIEFPDSIQPKYDVEVYRVLYTTTTPQGDVVTVSGILAAPAATGSWPLVSIQHGTEIRRLSSGYYNPMFYAPQALVTAAFGYVTIAADYLGLGISTDLHPYLYAPAEAAPVVDLIKAAQEVARRENIELNGQLFLVGYSEGGFVTLAAQRELEMRYASEIPITASAPCAGPYDLQATAEYLLSSRDYYEHPGYLAYLFYAYDNIYGWHRIDQIFQEPYASRIPDLLDGTKEMSEIDAALTPYLDRLLDSSFVADFLSGRDSVFRQALRENSPLDWAPQVPTRFFHGTADSTVPYFNSVTAYDSLRARGATEVSLVPIPQADHQTALLPVMLQVGAWFDSLKTQGGPS